ncbi:MAG TPA: MCE family protein [Marmoricola sp.]|jgi:virulence factor Mce-like protein|nr:MCE family protein [Marmoricola sp.]
MRRLAWRPMPLAVLLAVLIGCSGCTPLQPDTIRITARLADAAGLFVGNDVGILGVPVGTVTAIVPDGTGVEVELEIDADQPVPADAGAVVVARSVATDRYVELTPVYRGGARMKDGAVIAQPLTRTPVDFDTVLAALNTLATGLAGKGETAGAVGRIVRAGSSALDGRGRAFNHAVTALSEAVNGVAAQRGDITGTLTALDTLTRTLAENQQTVRTFVDQVARASDLLADERRSFRTGLDSLQEAVVLVARFARDNRHAITTSLDRSTALMRSLLRRRGNLEEVLRVMPLALENLRRTESDGYLRVALDPTLLTPLGGLVEQLCTGPVPPQACTAIGPTLTQRIIDDSPLGALLGRSR